LDYSQDSFLSVTGHRIFNPEGPSLVGQGSSFFRSRS